jgi:hypothetical protein
LSVELFLGVRLLLLLNHGNTIEVSGELRRVRLLLLLNHGGTIEVSGELRSHRRRYLLIEINNFELNYGHGYLKIFSYEQT